MRRHSLKPKEATFKSMISLSVRMNDVSMKLLFFSFLMLNHDIRSEFQMQWQKLVIEDQICQLWNLLCSIITFHFDFLYLRYNKFRKCRSLLVDLNLHSLLFFLYDINSQIALMKS